MINKQKNIKLRLSIQSHHQGFLNRKTLFASLLATSIVIGVASFAYAEDMTTIQFADTNAINQLRTYYNSPTKTLNKVIQKSSKNHQELPAFSQKTGKAYVNGKYSETKSITNNKKEDGSVFNWLSLDGKYSKFYNDPAYDPNSPKKSDTIKTTQSNFDTRNIDTSVTTVRINDQIAYDFEVIVWPDGTVSVPIKTLAEILDVSTEQNHVNNNISFKQPGTDEQVTIDVANNKIIVGNNVISINDSKLHYVKEGFIVKNDVFIPEQIAKDLLDIKTNFLKENYVLDLSTNRVLKAIVELNDQANDTSKYVIEEPISKVDEAVKENKMFKFKKLTYNIGSSMNQSYSSSGGISNSSANLGFHLNGNLLGGEYNIGASTYYNQNGLQISNYRASLDYIRPKYEFSIGSTNVGLSDMVMSGGNILGLRFGSVGAANGSSSVPRLIQGKADDNSYVEIFINDVYAEKQLVKNGRFEFDSLNYPGGSMVHIRVEQIGQDGKRTIVYDRKFSQDRDLLAAGQKQYLIFSGIDASTFSNNLAIWGDTFNPSYAQPVKWVSGAKYRMGITDNLTLGVNVAKDIIIKQPSKLFLYNNAYALASARSYRTGRSSSGAVISLDMDYAATQNLRISGEAGVSTATSKVDPFFDPDGNDFGGFIGLQYNRKNFSLNAKAFSYGPNFYSPGSNGLIDRKGVELSSNWQVGKVNFSGGVTRYNSNLDYYFPGGYSTICDYFLYASGNIDENSTIRAGIRSMGAENGLYGNRDTTYDITINRKLSNKANLMLNYARTISKYKAPGVSNNVTSQSNGRLNAEFTYDAGKLGVIRLANEMMMLDPADRLLLGGINQDYFTQPVYSKNIRLTLDRSQLPIKGFTFSPNVGYRYGGMDKGLNFGLAFGYMFKSGRQIGINYAYNSSFGKYMSGALSFGGNNSHSISFNYSDSLGFGRPKSSNNSFQSNFDPNSGVIKGKVFVDLNQNGILDEGEKGVSDIDVSFQNLFNVTTDKEGNFIAANIPAGLRKIGVNKDTLPVIYSPTIADALVNVKREKVYVANLGIIVTPGSITGKVQIDKVGLTNGNVVVLLLDKKGKEVKYTTTDSTGGYYLGSIAPGEYTIVVDRNYLDYKGLQQADKEAQTISIPVVIDDFVDITAKDITLIPKQGDIQKF